MPRLPTGFPAARFDATFKCSAPSLPGVSEHSGPTAICPSTQLWATRGGLLSGQQLPRTRERISHLRRYWARPISPLEVRRVWECRGGPAEDDALYLYIFEISPPRTQLPIRTRTQDARSY